MDAKPVLPGMLDRPSYRHRFFRVCQHGRSAKQFIFRWWGYSCRLVWLHTGRVLQWTRKCQWDRRLYSRSEVRAIRAFHRPTSNRKNTGLEGEEQSVPDGNAAQYQFADLVPRPRFVGFKVDFSSPLLSNIKSQSSVPTGFKESSEWIWVWFIRVFSDKRTK